MTSEPGPGAARRSQPLRVETRYLRVYLNDHLAVSEGIGSLVERMRAAERWQGHRALLERIAGDLQQDRADLEAVLAGHALKPNPVKRLLAVVGERAGRAKGNGRLLRSSPLARMVELEGLTIGLAACAAPWRTLLELDVEAERARAALERLERDLGELEALSPDVRASSFAD